MTSKPALLLLPNLLFAHKHHEPFLPQSVDKAVASIDGLISESEGGGRRYLGRFQTKKPAQDIPIALYNKNTKDEDIDFLLEPISKGERWGLVSDAGLPCIADPGSKIVARARKLGINIRAFVGPSSIFLGLLLSGLHGQSFTFHGYLDKDTERLKITLKMLEDDSKKHGRTQIFMERPYRNRQTLECLLESLHPSTLLCAAWELTSPDQGVLTQTVDTWKKSPLPNLDKKNTIFLFNHPSPS